MDIFLYLPGGDLGRASIVCKQWNDIIQNHPTWEIHIFHTCNYYLTFILLQQLQKGESRYNPNFVDRILSKMSVYSVRYREFSL